MKKAMYLILGILLATPALLMAQEQQRDVQTPVGMPLSVMRVSKPTFEFEPVKLEPLHGLEESVAVRSYQPPVKRPTGEMMYVIQKYPVNIDPELLNSMMAATIIRQEYPQVLNALVLLADIYKATGEVSFETLDGLGLSLMTATNHNKKASTITQLEPLVLDFLNKAVPVVPESSLAELSVKVQAANPDKELAGAEIFKILDGKEKTLEELKIDYKIDPKLERLHELQTQAAVESAKKAEKALRESLGQ